MSYKFEAGRHLIASVRGLKPGPTLIALGGIHGNEPAGALAALRVVDALEAMREKLCGEVVLRNGNTRALEYQRKKANQVVTILGSKTPNIQNLAVGGVANAINLNNDSTLNMSRLYMIKDLLDEVATFVQQVYVPDVCAIAGMYPEWLGYGAGVKNYLAVPDLPLDTRGTTFDLPGGTIFDGKFTTFKAIDSFNNAYFKENVQESIAHAWYKGDWSRHPFDEERIPVREDVQGACEILGFDPLYLANEGRFIAFVPERYAEQALAVINREAQGGARLIGRVTEDASHLVFMKSRIGATRIIDMFSGEQLPRIC